jgi:hypothetical protein
MRRRGMGTRPPARQQTAERKGPRAEGRGSPPRPSALTPAGAGPPTRLCYLSAGSQREQEGTALHSRHRSCGVAPRRPLSAAGPSRSPGRAAEPTPRSARQRQQCIPVCRRVDLEVNTPVTARLLDGAECLSMSQVFTTTRRLPTKGPRAEGARLGPRPSRRPAPGHRNACAIFRQAANANRTAPPSTRDTAPAVSRPEGRSAPRGRARVRAGPESRPPGRLGSDNSASRSVAVLTWRSTLQSPPAIPAEK